MLFYPIELKWYFLFTGLIRKDEMNNLAYVFQVICVGLAVATFLGKTGRGVKAVEVAKECLIFVNNVVPKKKEKQFVKFVRFAIYGTIFMAYCLISDYTNAIKYGKQLLDIYQERGKTLAKMYEKQFKYVEAGKFYEKAIKIMRESGNRRGEAAAYSNLGVVFSSLGEYNKAKQYLDKALTITIEFADKEGEANCYGNLGTVSSSLGEYGKGKEYLEKALAIRIEIGDKKGEAADCGNLGVSFSISWRM